jgi:HD-GYP domain-containing protein (c-di-GMP phosphodiesterase class II)
MRLLKFTDRKNTEATVNLEILQPAGLQRRIPLDRGEFRIGRDAACALRLDFPDVSRAHARIYQQGKHWLVEDSGSRNGVWVNGERIGRKQLGDGDLVKIGATLIRFNGERRALSSSDMENVEQLLEISRAISSSLVPEEVLERIIDSVAGISGAERAFLMLSSEGGELELKVARNIDREVIESSEFRISQSVAREAAQSGRSIVIDRVPDGGGTESIEALGLKAVACLPLVLKDRVIGVIYADSRSQSWIRELDLQILESLASHAAVAIENARLNQEQKEAFFNTSMALAEAIEARDDYTAGHSRRVTDYSVMIGRELGLSGEELDLLKIGSILHDIGKIGIHDCVLRKPGALDAYEYERIKRHPDIGARILGHVPQLSRVVPAVRHHHERFDGGGYPQGLAGEEIPLLARIIAVADAFDAMTSTRVYREELPVPVALAELRRCAGTQFDARIVEVFLRVFSQAVTGRESGEGAAADSPQEDDLVPSAAS